jgi:lipopolysaccharide/colanic/teichoic acid biosynthesis glycosyltransferase
MKIWPVLLDSQPACLSGRGCSGSLLLAPLGAHTLLEYLRACLEPVTRNAPLIVPLGFSEIEYGDWVRSVSPTAKVAVTLGEVADTVANFELSDTLLIIDPRCLPIRALEFSSLLEHYSAEPRMSHHLVSFKRAVARTQERVSFDSSGHVRKILRHYESATWPFIAGVSAMLVPVASGILSDGQVPSSLGDLRRVLAQHGVPSRDVPVQGGVFDLADEAGLLAANDHFARKALKVGQRGTASAVPHFVGTGHSIHASARITGSVVIHPKAQVEENAMVVGPAVIGAGARISSGAVVTHAVVGPGCTVPSGAIIRGRVWCGNVDGSARTGTAEASYRERLARLMAEAPGHDESATAVSDGPLRGTHAALKRFLDVTLAALGLLFLSPLMCVAALLSWFESRGPIFYGDQREGLDGRVFRCWKFRTMYVGAHAAQLDFKAIDTTDGPHFKIDRDPRVTRVGRVLRALNVDEIPQLFNVLTGEMSLVGPRPSPFRENQVCVPWREARLSVRPGITGLWQVCRHNRADGDFHQWIEYDLLYVQHMSFWLDLKILAATLVTLGGKAGHAPAWRLVSSASIELETRAARLEVVRSPASAKQVATT